MKFYLIISTLIFLYLGLAWSNKTFKDFLMKCILITMAGIGLIFTLVEFGYIFKTI